MMECDEIIDYINEAEIALETLRKFWSRKQKPTPLAVAAFAFAHMQHDATESEFDNDPMAQCQALFRLAVWVEDLRQARDPRCNLCKQAGELKSNSQTAISEVVQ